MNYKEYRQLQDAFAIMDQVKPDKDEKAKLDQIKTELTAYLDYWSERYNGWYDEAMLSGQIRFYDNQSFPA
jgi:hypothetical protein